MFKYYILSIVFTITSFNDGPIYNVDWGPSYKKDGGLFAGYRLTGMHNDHYYVLMNPRKKNTMLKYDMNHKLVSSKQLDMKLNGKYLNIDKIIDTKNGSFGQMLAYDRKKNKFRLFVSQLKNGNFGEHQEIFAHDFSAPMMTFGLALINNTDTDSRTLIASADGSHVGYTSVQTAVDNRKNEQLSVAVFDADMNVVWQKTQKFNYSDKNLEINQTVVGNDGAIYIIGKEKDTKASKGAPKFSFKVFKITEDEMKEYKIALGSGYYPTDAGIFFPHDDKEFIISGFYSSTGKGNSILGTFHASGNSNSGIKTINKDKFDNKFLEGLASKRSIRKGSGIFPSFRIKDFIQYGDGSVSFIAEERYTVVTRTTDSEGNRSKSYTYHSNELIIPKFSVDGTLANIHKVDKWFYSSSLTRSSYSLGLHNNETYLFFNDFKNKKERKEIGGADGKKKNGIFTDLVIIDKHGEIRHNETLFDSNETEFIFNPYFSDYYGDTFLLGSLSKTGKKYAFGTFKMK